METLKLEIQQYELIRERSYKPKDWVKDTIQHWRTGNYREMFTYKLDTEKYKFDNKRIKRLVAGSQ